MEFATCRGANSSLNINKSTGTYQGDKDEKSSPIQGELCMPSSCVGKGIYLVCLCARGGGRSEQEEQGSKWDEAGSCHGLEQGKSDLFLKRLRQKQWELAGSGKSRLHHCLSRAGWGLPAVGWGGVIGQRKHIQAGEVECVDGERCGDKWHLIIVLLPTTNTLCTPPVPIQHVTKFSQPPLRQACLSSPYPQ